MKSTELPIPADATARTSSEENESTPPTREMRLSYRIMRVFVVLFFKIYLRSRYFGLENVPATGPVLLVCNHQSFLDPPAASYPLTRECAYMARDTLFRNRFFRRLIVHLNAFPVKRGHADVTAVKEGVRRLKKNYVVTIFPEATRTRDGSIGRINPNSMALAKMARATIVPTVIDGAFEAWPRTRLLPGPGKVYISYMPPISPDEVRAWSVEEIAFAVQERLNAGMAESRSRRGRKCRP